MGINTTADNTATNNVAAIEISIVVMPHIILLCCSSTCVIFEVFAGAHFKRWQERIFSVLDMYGVVWVLTDPKTSDNAEA
jgi:hypothetical protein